MNNKLKNKEKNIEERAIWIKSILSAFKLDFKRYKSIKVKSIWVKSLSSIFKLGFIVAIEICKLKAKKEKNKTGKEAINKLICFMKNIDLNDLYESAPALYYEGEKDNKKE